MAKFSMNNLIPVKLPTSKIVPSGTRRFRGNQTITSEENNRLLENSYVPINNHDPISLHDIQETLSDTAKSVARRREDNSKIKKLVPEIGVATTLHVASILSPNDLQTNKLTFAIDNESLDETSIKKIIKSLEQMFINTYDLEKKLKEWIAECFSGSGSKAVLIIPEGFFFNRVKNDLIYASEGLKELPSGELVVDYETLGENYTNFSTPLKDVSPKGLIKPDESSDYALCAAMEEVYYNDESKRASDNNYSEPLNTNHIKQKGVNASKDIVTKIQNVLNSKELITFTENPFAVKAKELQTKAALEGISDNIFGGKNQSSSLDDNGNSTEETTHRTVKVKEEPFLELENVYHSDLEISNPIIQEWPSEAIIPMFIPGTPDDHIFYLGLIDTDKGCPLTFEENDLKENVIDEAYTSMFGSNFYNLDQSTNKKKLEAVNGLYENMLTKYIQNSLSQVSINNVDIQFNNAVLSCMFRRFLMHKKTQVLFIPKELMVYYRFDTMPDGTGKSKIEDAKFIISSEIGLLVSDLMANMNNSTPTDVIRLTLDKKVTNPQKYMNEAKKAHIKDKTFKMGAFDPKEHMESQIARNTKVVIEDSELPGVKKSVYDHERGNKETARPDTDLRDTIRRRRNVALVVPASSFNDTSQFEYARTAANSHLLYNNQVCMDQQIVCEFTNKLIRNICKLSRKMRDEIANIITTDKRSENQNTDIEVNDIIDSIRLSLPVAKMAPTKAQFEELSSMIDFITTLYEKIHSEEKFAHDRDLQEFATSIREVLLAKAVKNHIATTGLAGYVDMFDTSDGMLELNDIHLKLANITKMYSQIKNKLDGENMR